MSKGLIEVILLLSGVAVGAAVWFFLKRPLALLAWGTRRSLIATGLKKHVVQTPDSSRITSIKPFDMRPPYSEKGPHWMVVAAQTNPRPAPTNTMREPSWIFPSLSPSSSDNT